MTTATSQADGVAVTVTDVIVGAGVVGGGVVGCGGVVGEAGVVTARTALSGEALLEASEARSLNSYRVEGRSPLLTKESPVRFWMTLTPSRNNSYRATPTLSVGLVHRNATLVGVSVPRVRVGRAGGETSGSLS